MSTGDGGRNVRVTSLLEELVANFLRNEANTDPMITVTHVSPSPDLKKATVYVSVFPDGREEDALIFLKRKGSALRDEVKHKARLKHIPFFDFQIDYGEKNRQRIDEIKNDTEKKASEGA